MNIRVFLRQRRHLVPLCILVAAILILIYTKMKTPGTAPTSDSGAPVIRRFYVSHLPKTDIFHELSGVPLYLNETRNAVTYRSFSQRSGQNYRAAGVKWVSLPGHGSQRLEGYMLNEAPSDDDASDAPVVTVDEAAYHLLTPCPAQPGDDPNFIGVTRIWKGGDESMLLRTQGVHQAQVGDTVTVEIKNLDGWIFSQFDLGHLLDNLDRAPDSFKSALKEIVGRRRSLRMLIDLTTLNRMLQVKRDPDWSDADWKGLLKFIDDDENLSALKNAHPNAKTIPKESPFTREHLAWVQAAFFPVKNWCSAVTATVFHQLTLTINGVTLVGVTTGNGSSMKEVLHEDRPSNWDELYQWATFKLERRTPSVGSSDEVRLLAVQNSDAWNELIGRPAFSLPCKVTLRQPSTDLELPTLVTPSATSPDCRFTLIGLSYMRFASACLVCLVVIAALALLALTTNILRDTGGRVRPDGIEPVSLGKTQMAFWFILVTSAFSFLWVTKDAIDTLNDTCLILIGLGSGTALGAALLAESAGERKYLVVAALGCSRDEIQAELARAILVRMEKIAFLVKDRDSDLLRQIVIALRKLMEEPSPAAAAQQPPPGKRVDFHSLLAKVEAEWKSSGKDDGLETSEDAGQSMLTLAGMLKDHESGPGPLDPKGGLTRLAGELELLGVQWIEFKEMPVREWRRLVADWLCEGSSKSYSFHRFQMMAWTLLLGCVFIYKLVNDRTMPEFSGTTLALLGISSGTYLGFKLPTAGKVESSKS